MTTQIIDALRRRRGRPARQFLQSRDRLLARLAVTPENEGTDKMFADEMRCTPRQVSRWLRALRKDGLIQGEISHGRHRGRSGKVRVITITPEGADYLCVRRETTHEPATVGFVMMAT